MLMIIYIFVCCIIKHTYLIVFIFFLALIINLFVTIIVPDTVLVIYLFSNLSSFNAVDLT